MGTPSFAKHPVLATSWQLGFVKASMATEQVNDVVGDQCQEGQGNDRGDPMKKPTRFMSNSEAVLAQLGNRRKGRSGACARPWGGQHSSCTGQVARKSAVYSFKLCKAIFMVCRNQPREDGMFTLGIVGIQPAPRDGLTDEQLERRVNRPWNIEVEEGGSEETGPLKRDPEFQALNGNKKLQKQHRLLTGLKVEEQSHEMPTNDLMCQLLDPGMVKSARRVGLAYFEAKGVWERRGREERLGKKWQRPYLRTLGGHQQRRWCHAELQKRLVARDIRKKGEDPIFAPTPPLESPRAALSLATTNLNGEKKHDRDPSSPSRTQISFADIARAYFCATTDPDDPTHVKLPSEDGGRERWLCGLLPKHMHGTKKAADGWHGEHSGALADLGCTAGIARACVFRHPSRGVACSVHGDDLTTEGPENQLDWFVGELRKKYEPKGRARLRPGKDDDKEARIVNRLVRWTEEGIEHEADPRQAERLVRDLNLSGCKSVCSPGVKPTGEQVEADVGLEPRKHRPSRAMVARGNCPAPDRPEAQHAAKEVCRWMSKPNELF